MKKITNREKVLIGAGGLVTIGILFYFFLLPVLKSDQSKSDLKAKQEKLQSIEQLRAMEPTITEMEKNMRNQLGYNQVSFKRNSADAMIMKQLAQIANQSEIKEIEQLDVKPDKSKKSLANLKPDQATLKSTVDNLYMSQITMDNNNPITKEIKVNNPDLVPPSNGRTDLVPPNPPDSAELRNGRTEENKVTKEIKKDSDNPDETSTTKSLTFPMIPKDIPEEAKQALIKFIQTHNGQTITKDNIDEVVSPSGIKDEKEINRIKKRLITYGDRVKEKKTEVVGILNKLGTLQNVNAKLAKLDDKYKAVDRFTAKMVFKSDISQLIRLLYNLQTSARWVKVEGIQITMADRQKSLLGVELSMTATAVYD